MKRRHPEMKLHVILLLIWSLCRHRVDCSLPDFTPATHLLQVEASVNSESKVVSVLMKNEVSRLPGLCRRLKRRRITVLCNLEKFCWWGRSQGRGQVGQVCRCPRGSRCSHFFVHSL
ncbi:uncharacterized protein si:ch211-191i18.4 isoform X2 [Pleuronectes platessa]|uniref:uncharacterized protein si:ch211-191i18.4 isoform X2 n=1 Tax=Pleuronectes platessa TaxID=8262 RepID=UPI00232A49BC|nr:uncharacterized protein si:ch211-191i18.4 isoform X2 [Pleuronectes platessa]